MQKSGEKSSAALVQQQWNKITDSFSSVLGKMKKSHCQRQRWEQLFLAFHQKTITTALAFGSKYGPLHEWMVTNNKNININNNNQSFSTGIFLAARRKN